MRSRQAWCGLVIVAHAGIVTIWLFAQPKPAAVQSSPVVMMNLVEFNQRPDLPAPVAARFPTDSQPDPLTEPVLPIPTESQTDTSAPTTSDPSHNLPTTGAAGAAQIDEQVLAAYGAAIRQEIERHKRYPYAARMRAQEGAVTVRFWLASNGQLLSQPTIETPTPYDLLNRAAVRSIQESGQFPPFPRGLEAPSQEFVVNIKFQLP